MTATLSLAQVLLLIGTSMAVGGFAVRVLLERKERTSYVCPICLSVSPPEGGYDPRTRTEDDRDG